MSATLRPEAALDLHPDFVMVLLVMCRHLGDDLTCWPSLKTIATRLGVTRAAVCMRLARMKRAGVIEIEPHYRDDGGRSSSIYRVDRRYVVPLGAAAEPTPPPVKRRAPDVRQREMLMPLQPSKSAETTAPRAPDQTGESADPRSAPLNTCSTSYQGIEEEDSKDKRGIPLAAEPPKIGGALKERIRRQWEMKLCRFMKASTTPSESGAFLLQLMELPAGSIERRRLCNAVDQRMRRAGWDDMSEWKRQNLAARKRA